MTILITGGGGQLALQLQQQAMCQQLAVVLLTRQQLDICQPEQIEAVLDHYDIKYMVNTAAYTAVDRAESEQEKAYAINRDGAAVLAKVCAKKNMPLIHLSTDYVFDGNATVSYDEDSRVNPINVYGHSKWLGECEIRKYLPQHIILRVSSVFGQHGHNFVKTMLKLMMAREQLNVVSDQVSCPSSTVAISNAILSIIANISADKKEWGTYHYCHQEAISWYQFALAIFETAGRCRTLKTKTVAPILASDYPLEAKRPQYSALDCAKIKRHFNIEQISYYPQLKQVIEQYESKL